MPRLICLFTTLLVLVFISGVSTLNAQNPYNVITCDPVEFSGDLVPEPQNGERMTAAFRQPDGGSIVISAQHQSPYLVMYKGGTNTIDCHRFDAQGKLVGSYSEKLNGSLLDTDYLHGFYQMKNMIVLVTSAKGESSRAFSLWKVVDYNKFEKVSTIDGIAGDKDNADPVIRISQNGEFMLIVSNAGNRYTVVNSNLKQEYTRSLYDQTKKSEVTIKLDDVSVDNKGQVSFSALLNGEASWYFKVSTYSWVFGTLNPKTEEIRVTNVAEIFGLKHYSAKRSEVVDVSENEVVLMYSVPCELGYLPEEYPRVCYMRYDKTAGKITHKAELNLTGEEDAIRKNAKVDFQISGASTENGNILFVCKHANYMDPQANGVTYLYIVQPDGSVASKILLNTVESQPGAFFHNGKCSYVAVLCDEQVAASAAKGEVTSAYCPEKGKKDWAHCLVTVDLKTGKMNFQTIDHGEKHTSIFTAHTFPFSINNAEDLLVEYVEKKGAMMIKVVPMQ